MKANKAYKYRIYPNEEQKVFFAKTFGCVRFVYNKMLSEKIEYCEQTHKTLHNTPAHLKKEYPWLKEVDSLALANAQLQLQTAFANFFRDEKTGFPKYRSKKGSRKSYTTNNQRGTIRLQDGRLRLPKVSPIRIKLHRLVPDGYTIKSVTVAQESSGKYYASVLTEYEAEPQHVAVRPEYSLGLDYSSPHFYVDSNGEVADMPHYYRNAELKLAKEQRKLSKMVRGSNNYKKQKYNVGYYKRQPHISSFRKAPYKADKKYYRKKYNNAFGRKCALSVYMPDPGKDRLVFALSRLTSDIFFRMIIHLLSP